MRTGYGLALIASALVCGCGGGGAGRHGADVLMLARDSDASSLDPAATIATADWSVISLMYRRLVTIDPETGAPTPDLAAGWSASDDSRIWTIELNDDISFSDGSPITADAVAFSLRRLLRSRGGTIQNFAIIEDVEAVDRLTVRITLERSAPSFIYALSLGISGIVNPAVMAHERGGDLGSGWLSEQSAGSGPYRLRTWQRSQHIMLERNPNYAGPPPDIGTVSFQIIPDASSQRLKLEAGDLDLVERIRPNDIDRYRVLRSVRIEEVAAWSEIFFLAMNTVREPFDDVRVRRAIAAAIDYETLVGKILEGNAEVPRSPVPPGITGHDPDLPKPARDLEEARRLLAAAGHPDGISATLLLAKESTLGEFLQSNLREAGVNVSLRRLAPSALDAARAAGDFDMFYGGWTLDYPHPAAFLVPAFSSENIGGSNFSRYSNPRLDRMFRDAAAAEEERKDDIYRRAARIVVTEKPFALLFAPHRAVAIRKGLKGLRLNRYQSYVLNLNDVSRDEST